MLTGIDGFCVWISKTQLPSAKSTSNAKQINKNMPQDGARLM